MFFLLVELQLSTIYTMLNLSSLNIKSHSKKISGTGLGLSIVKHGAEYHGGYVTLESIPQKGTTFEIHL